jgi:predicted nucleic acid-binding protein
LSAAYVDTSAIVSLILHEPDEEAIVRQLNQFDRVMSSNLLEAELRSVCHREGRALDAAQIRDIQWIQPNRALTPEISRVLAAGYVRGADCWHLASALFATPDPTGVVFLTRDVRQRDVATALGFAT